MSDVEWCQNCGDVVTDDGCACAAIPKPTGVLTRLVIRRDIGHGFIEDPNGQFVRYTEAQHVITQQAQELERVTKELNHQTRQRAYEFAASQKQAQELEQAKGNYAIQKAAADDYEQQLAASQARCRDMEIALSHERPRDMQPVTVYTINSIISAGHSEHATFVLEMNYRAKEQQVAQLQATLAAREAEVDRLKLAQQHSIQDECEAEQRLIDAGISDYEDGGQGEYRGLLTQIDLCIKERDAAVRDAQRYRYLRARAALDKSDKQRITWHIPMWDIPRCYQDIPIKDQLDKDLDEAIRLA